MDIVKSLRKVRRQVASFSLATMIASFFAVSVAQAQTFPDVQPSDWFYSYVEDLVSQGIVNGSMPAYRPGDNVNRAEMAKLVVEAFDLTLEDPANATFKDTAKGQWYYTYVETAAKNGVVGGYKNDQGDLTGFYGPADPLTREQAAKMIVLGAPLTTNTSCGPSFPDVNLTRWSYEYVESLYAWSVVDGNPDGTFAPERNINRAEIAKIVSNAMDPVMRPCGGFNVEDVSAISSTSVEVCFNSDFNETEAMMTENYEILDQDAVALAVTGVEASSDPMCVLLTTASQEPGNSYDLMVTGVTGADGMELSIPDGSFTGFSAVGTGGDLTCTAGTQPGDATVPRGSTGVEFTVVNCSADADPVVISSMTFKRTGAGDEQDFDNVYLYNDSYRLTTGRSINSETQNVEFTGLNTTIEANSTKSFVVVGDIAVAAGANNHHSFSLENKDSIESNATSVGGTYPAMGSVIEISSAAAGVVTVTKNGSLDELTIGETGRIAQFELEASGTESMSLERIALYVRGTCDSEDVHDLKLYVEGGSEVLAETAEVGAKDLATFVLENPYLIPQGDNKIFYVEAQVTCRNAETVRTYLDETTDLHVIGNTFNQGVAVTNNYDGTGTQFSEVVVKGSDFTVAFSGKPTAGDIAVGQDDASCLDFTITNASGESVEIRDWAIQVDLLNVPVAGGGLINELSANDPNYQDFKLVTYDENGAVNGTLLGPSSLLGAGSDTSQPVILDGDNNIEAGESVNAGIVFDVQNNVLINGDKIRCTLQDLTLTPDAVRDLNGDALGAESITPASNIVGNTMTLSSAGLTFELAASPSSRTYVSGAMGADGNGVELAGFTVRSGSSLSNTIKSLTVQGFVDGDPVSAFGTGTDGGANLKDIVYANVALWDGDTKVSDDENINAVDGKIIFNNLTILVPKSTTKTLVLKGKISSSAPFAVGNDRVKFGIINQTDVVAIDSNGQNVNTGSIQVANASNAANTVVMTITAGGQGSVSEQGSPSQKLMTGNSAPTLLAKFKFDSQDEDVSLRDINLGNLNRNGASIESNGLTLKTGAACDQNVMLAGGGTSGGYTANGTSGIFQIEGLDLPILDAGDTYLCVYGATQPVSASGDPASGDSVGVVLLTIPEIIGGAGTNVTEKYMGTATPAVTVATNVLGTAAANSIDLSGVPATIAIGDVIIIDEEQMLATTVGADPQPVIRGFASSAITSHLAGEVVYESRLAAATGGVITASTAADTCVELGAALQPGDTVAVQDAAGLAFEYMIVRTPNTAVAPVPLGPCVWAAGEELVYRGAFGSTPLVFAGGEEITLFTANGPLMPLRASAPTFTAPSQVAGGVGGGTTTVLRFDVGSTGETAVDFNQSAADVYAPATDDIIQVRFTGSAANATITNCQLRNVTDNEILDISAGVLPASDAIEFNFFTNDLSIPQGTSKTLEVRCDLALVVGTTVSAQIDETEVLPAISTVVYDDNSEVTPVLVAEDGTLIDFLPIIGPTFNNP